VPMRVELGWRARFGDLLSFWVPPPRDRRDCDCARKREASAWAEQDVMSVTRSRGSGGTSGTAGETHILKTLSGRALGLHPAGHDGGSRRSKGSTKVMYEW
jgi:hypothetical protein